jgi:hypothetical protein
MKNKEALQIGEPAGAQAQGKAHPTRRILVVDGDMGSRQSSAEMLIRHETDSPNPDRRVDEHSRIPHLRPRPEF